MSDDTNVQTTPTADPDAIANATDTQSESAQTPPADGDSGNGDNAQPTPQSAPTESGIPDLTEAERREAGKLQQTQQELKTAQEVNQQFVSYATKTPERFKEALQDVRGMTDEQAAQEVEKLKQQGYWQEDQATPTAPQQPAIDPNQIAQQVTFEMEKKQGFEKFIEAVPEMNPANIKPENVQEVQELAGKVEVIAGSLLQAGLASNFSEALIKGYQTVTGKSSEEIASAREDGRIEGIAQSNANKASTGTPPASTTSGKSSSVSLTSLEQQQADAMGMTAEEFASFGQGETQVD